MAVQLGIEEEGAETLDYLQSAMHTDPPAAWEAGKSAPAPIVSGALLIFPFSACTCAKFP